MPSSRLELSEQLVGLLDYNSGTGELRWKYIMSTKKPTLEAGCINKDGYHVITFCGVQFFGHILAWRIHYGVWPSSLLDHKNRKRNENQIDNLREATSRENQLNSCRFDKPSVGISYNARCRKWKVTGGRPQRKHLGYYETFEEAQAARDEQHKNTSVGNTSIRAEM